MKALLLSLLTLTSLLNAAAGYVGGASGAVGGFASSLAVPYTATGGPGSLLVAHFGQYFYATNLSSVTWNGSNFTSITWTTGYSESVGVWYFQAPSSGLGTVLFTPAQGTNMTCFVEEYSNVNAVSPIGAIAVFVPPGSAEFADPGSITITTANTGSLISAAVHGVQQSNPITSTYAPGGGGSVLRGGITAPGANSYPTSGIGEYNSAVPGIFNVGFNFGGLGGNGNLFAAVEIKGAATTVIAAGPHMRLLRRGWPHM